MIRIICVGNRYVSSDSAGPEVYDQLVERDLPAGVEVVDGGLSGLNLLGLVEESDRVIFVDTVAGFGEPGEVMLVENAKEAFRKPEGLDHGTGLYYLLSVIDQVAEGQVPEILVVGLEQPCTGAAIWRAAEMSLVAAARDLKPREQKGNVHKELIA